MKRRFVALSVVSGPFAQTHRVSSTPVLTGSPEQIRSVDVGYGLFFPLGATLVLGLILLAIPMLLVATGVMPDLSRLGG